MLRSDICSRAATGGMRDSMEGKRVTSAFMSLSSSSSWFSTARKAGGAWGDACQTSQAERSRLREHKMGTAPGLAPQVRLGNSSQPQSRLPPALRAHTLVQDSVGRLVPSQGLFGEVLVALSKALHFCQPRVQCHGRVAGVLGHVEVRRPPQLLLDHQGLLQQLRGAEGEGFRASKPQSPLQSSHPTLFTDDADKHPTGFRVLLWSSHQ